MSTKSTASEETLSFMLSQECTDEARLRLLETLSEDRVTSPMLLTFRDELRKLQHNLNLPNQLITDICGTGGDGKSTLNISTTAAIVLAALGIKIAKHGNRSASSNVGSSDVLEALGIKLPADAGSASAQYEKLGVCFIHAPYFHPALKTLGPARKQFAKPSIFNLLGPLLNPARPHFQVIGVKSKRTLELYKEVLKREDLEYSLVYSLDGYDEVSLTSDTLVTSNHGVHTLSPKDFGFQAVQASELLCQGSPQGAALLIERVLRGEASRALSTVIAANVAIVLHLHSPTEKLSCLADLALATIFSGKGYSKLQELRAYEPSN